MKQHLYREEFLNAFLSSDTYKDNFSRNGLHALFDYLEDFEQDTGETIDFDYVAIACNYAEYSNAWEAMEQYQPDDMPTVEHSEGLDLIEIQEKSDKLALEWLRDRTQVIEVDGGRVIIQSF